MPNRQGRITDVVVYPAGSELEIDAVAGVQTLFVTRSDDFSDAGGQLVLDDPISNTPLPPVDYTTRDPLLDTISLALPLGAFAGAGTRVQIYPYASERWAHVVATNNDDEPIMCRIPHELEALLDVGVREPTAQESIEFAMDSTNTWIVRQIIGKVPELLGVFVSGAVTGSDGSPPPQVGAVTITAGVRSLSLYWNPSSNIDATHYRVYASTQSGFTIDSAKNFVGEAAANSFVLKQAYDPATNMLQNLDPLKGPYFVRVVAVDADGSAPPSDAVAGTPVQINTADIAVNAIAADQILSSSITADKLNAVLLLVSKLLVGDRITISPSDGIQIVGSVGTTKFPADGSAASIAGNLIAYTLTVMDSLNIRGANNYISGTVSLASGTTNPNSPPVVGQAVISEAWGSSSSVTRFPPGGANYPVGIAKCPTTSSFVLCSNGKLYGVTYASTLPITLVKTLDESVLGVGYSINSDINSIAFDAKNNEFLILASTGTIGGSYKIVRIGYTTGYPKNGEFSIQGPDPATTRSGLRMGIDWQAPYSAASPGIVTAWLRSDGAIVFARYNLAGVQQTAPFASSNRYGADPTFIDGTVALTNAPATAGWMISQDSRLTFYDTNGNWGGTTRDFYSSQFRTRRSSGNCLYGVSSIAGESYVELDYNSQFMHYSTRGVQETIYAGYTWYDLDTAGSYGAGGESQLSPTASALNLPGAMTRLDVPAPPDGGDPDDPNVLRLYLSNDGGATYKLQGNTSEGQTAIALQTVKNGSTPPISNAFATRPNRVGSLRATTSDTFGPLWQLKGDGSGRTPVHSWDANGSIGYFKEQRATSTFTWNVPSGNGLGSYMTVGPTSLITSIFGNNPPKQVLLQTRDAYGNILTANVESRSAPGAAPSFTCIFRCVYGTIPNGQLITFDWQAYA